jgi:hypothetical protein
LAEAAPAQAIVTRANASVIASADTADCGAADGRPKRPVVILRIMSLSSFPSFLPPSS